MYEVYVECCHFDSWKETGEYMSKEKDVYQRNENSTNFSQMKKKKTHFCLHDEKYQCCFSDYKEFIEIERNNDNIWDYLSKFIGFKLIECDSKKMG